MHSLKILPFSPPPALPRHRCSPYQTVVSCRPRRPGLPFSLASPAASPSYAVSLPSQSPHPARRYRGSCVMAGARNVQRSFVGVV